MNPKTHSQAIADPVAAITGFADAVRLRVEQRVEATQVDHQEQRRDEQQRDRSPLESRQEVHIPVEHPPEPEERPVTDQQREGSG